MKIPAGVKDGARIKLAGRGEPGPAGRPAGRPVRAGAAWRRTTVFGRKGDDLTLTLPVTFPEAALGANVQVPTLNGPVTLKVPAGTPSGKTFRIKGKGAPQGKGGHGDLLVTSRSTCRASSRRSRRAAASSCRTTQEDSPREPLGVA